jgi:CRISPR-associated protein Cas2
MMVVCYDIANTKTRNRLVKILTKHGKRIQYSVFEIEDYRYVLNKIQQSIFDEFNKRLKNNDSIVFFKIPDTEKESITRMGLSNKKKEGFDSLNFD